MTRNRKPDGTHVPPEAWADLFPLQVRTKIDVPACTVVRAPLDYLPKTVIVLGAYRGGTSFIAELLAELGVWIGDVYSPVTPNPNYVSYEDADLASALDPLADNWRDSSPEYIDLLREKIAERDRRFPLWGFKKPSAAFVFDKIVSYFRNPHAIAVLRDPLASHQGGIAHGVTITGRLSISDCRAHFGAVMEFVDRPRCPTLAISYERAKDRVAETRKAIMEFIGLCEF